MPFYDYICLKCGNNEANIYVLNKDFTFTCPRCHKEMVRKFPTAVHGKVGSSIDSKDSGKVVAEKNRQLKKRESGYQHEEQNLRKKITKMVQDKTS